VPLQVPTDRLPPSATRRRRRSPASRSSATRAATACRAAGRPPAALRRPCRAPGRAHRRGGAVSSSQVGAPTAGAGEAARASSARP